MESYPIDLRVALKESGASFIEKLNNEEDDQIIDSKLQKMKEQDENTLADVHEILKFLKTEEAILFSYINCTDSSTHPCNFKEY